MKKTLFFVLLVAVVAASAVLILAGCDNGKLPSPLGLDILEETFVWDKVDGADGYLVYFNDDDVNRYFITNNYLSMNEPQIRGSLLSGQVNRIYIRAVTLDADRKPAKKSDRSLILFHYSKQLATPNGVKMKNEKFSWQGVSEAQDYKAYVRRDTETTGTLYDMTWSTGTTSVNGTINNLPDGYMYYVSLVAVATGYTSSAPSVEVPYDRSVKANDKGYVLMVGQTQYAMSADAESGLYYAQATVAQGDAFTVQDATGKQYAFAEAEDATATTSGTYLVTLDDNTGTAQSKPIAVYTVYVGGSSVGSTMAYSLVDNSYAVTVAMSLHDTYVVKDADGNVLAQYATDSVNQGEAATAGNYVVRVDSNSLISTSVSSGAQQSADLNPVYTTDGKWPVVFSYNYDGAPDDIVVYASHNRPVPTPAQPTRAGFDFVGWYMDAYGLIAAEFGANQSNFAITSPTKLYAKWNKASEVVVPVECVQHVDENNDNICDNCHKVFQVQCTDHLDTDKDGKCDKCGAVIAQPCKVHYDTNGDGLCDKCGAEITAVADTYGTIYLDASDFAWFGDASANINVHIWYTDGTNNGWPGAKMTLNSDGLYEAAYYTSRTVKGIIFTRNDPNTKPDEGVATEWDRVDIGELSFDPARPVYKLLTYAHNADAISFTGRWIKEGENVQTVGDGKLYLDFRDVEWYNSASAAHYVYVWYTDGTDNATYPGKQATFTTDATSARYSYFVDYDTAKTLAGVIFTRNNPNLPITGEGEGLWNKVELSLAQNSLTFAADLPAYRLYSLSGSTYTGEWESEAAATTADVVVVPEVPVVEEVDNSVSEGVYFYLNAANVDWFASDGAVIKAVVYYTDGTHGTQAGAAATMDGTLYRWGYNSAKTVDKVTILRQSPEGEEWNRFDIHLNADAAQNVVVLTSYTDNNGVAYVYRQYGATDTADRTIYYRNQNGWSQVNCYWWQDGVGAFCDWPGKAMQAVVGHDGWYSIAINASATHVIFTNGTDQTGNIELDAQNLYYNNGWTASYEAPQPEWDGKLVLDVSGIDWFGNDGAKAACYVWYTDESENKAWPGAVMSWDSVGNVYTYQTDTANEVAIVIFVRVSADGTTAYNKTINITVIPVNGKFVLTASDFQ